MVSVASHPITDTMYLLKKNLHIRRPCSLNQYCSGIQYTAVPVILVTLCDDFIVCVVHNDRERIKIRSLCRRHGVAGHLQFSLIPWTHHFSASLLKHRGTLKAGRWTLSSQVRVTPELKKTKDKFLSHSQTSFYHTSWIDNLVSSKSIGAIFQQRLFTTCLCVTFRNSHGISNFSNYYVCYGVCDQ